MAYTYEQATMTRLKRKAFNEAVPRTQLGDVLDVRLGTKWTWGGFEKIWEILLSWWW